MELYILSGLPIGLREMLEAMLIALLSYEIIGKSFKLSRKRKVQFISITMIVSFLISIPISIGIYYGLESLVTTTKKNFALIEGILAFTIIPFIIWVVFEMAKYKRIGFKKSLSNKVNQSLWKFGIIIFLAIFRESLETAFCAFGKVLADGKETEEYTAYGVLIGASIALFITALLKAGISFISIKVILNITLIYLIIQTSYIFGYGLHEVSEFISNNDINSSHMFKPAFNLRETVLSKNEPLGITLNILFGFYDKPEPLMLIGQITFLTWLSAAIYIRVNKIRYVKFQTLMNKAMPFKRIKQRN